MSIDSMKGPSVLPQQQLKVSFDGEEAPKTAIGDGEFVELDRIGIGVEPHDTLLAKEQFMGFIRSPQGEKAVGSLAEASYAFRKVYRDNNNDPRRTFGTTGMIISNIIQNHLPKVEALYFSPGFDQVAFVDNIVQSLLALNLDANLYIATEDECEPVAQQLLKLLNEDEDLREAVLTKCKASIAASMEEFARDALEQGEDPSLTMDERYELAFIQEFPSDGILSICSIFSEITMPALKPKIDDAQSLKVIESPTFAGYFMRLVADQVALSE